MRTEIDQMLARTGRVATRTRLLTVVSRAELDHEVRSGRLVAPFPGTLCRPWDADDPALQDRAALTSIGPPAALSHQTSLRRWGLWDEPPSSPRHVTVGSCRAPRHRPGLVVHRAARFPPTVRLDGLPTTRPAEAIAASWPLMAPQERRAPAITAVRRRVVTCAQLSESVRSNDRLPGRAELAELVDLLAAGCESELEIWGLLHVFDVPGLRHGVRQHRVSTPRGRFRVDLAYVAERVAVELDGATYHSTRSQRERDMRRDAAFAAIDWLTLRFSFARLHREVDSCRRDTLATLAARRR